MLDNQGREKKSLLKSVIEGIKNNRLILEGEKILLGFSGGPDSRFLLEVLEEYQRECAYEIILAHINHNLRATASRDEEYCRALAQSKKIPLFVLSVDVEKCALEKGESIEECARKIRYEFFQDIVNSKKIDKISTAHHLNDNVETFLYRFSRGSSIYGLRGMSLKEGVKIRPLITSEKRDIVSYLDSHGIEYCIDETNFENIYTRNKIRNRVIPYLEKVEPLAQIKIAQMQEDLFEIHQDIERFFPSPYVDGGINLEILRQFSPYVVKYYIAKWCMNSNISLSRSKLEQIFSTLNRGGTVKHDVKNFYLVKEYDRLKLEKKDVQSESPILFVVGKPLKWNGFTLVSRVFQEPFERKKGAVYLDFNKIQGKNCVIRSRQEGDYMVPLGMNSKKKLKDMMINDKIPLSRRKQIPLLCEKDEVIVMFTSRISENYKVLGETQHCVELIIKEEM